MQKTINFVGNFSIGTQMGYGSEPADETHIARELESWGNVVRKIPRDEWREHVLDGQPYRNVPEDLRADINIICKWHHFYDGRFIDELRKRSNAPVFYWVWDYMQYGVFPEWHLANVEASDLYLGNDVRNPQYPQYLKNKLYYFNFDCVDRDIPTWSSFNNSDHPEYKYDVVFLGSYLDQGNRLEFLRHIKDKCNLQIFSVNYEDWRKEGFKADPAVYGQEANLVMAQSKINIGFSVEAHCWGYWSNRVGRVLNSGGFLLYEYAPGMEIMIGEAAAYFSTPEEAVEKINFYLNNEKERQEIIEHAKKVAWRFTSKQRTKELMILIDRTI